MVANSSRPWYAGRCVSRHDHDKVVNIEVIARLEGNDWMVLANARHLFGGVEEVELRCGHARAIKIGEWEMFQLSKKGKKFWIAGEHRKLYQYCDLSSFGGAAHVQRHLASDELQTSESSGSWILRSQDSEVLQVELRQLNGIAHIANGTSKIPAFPYDPNCVARMPFKGRVIELYELRHKGDPVSIYDWSSDEAYATRVIKGIASASDPRARAAIGWFEEHGKTQESLALSGAVDLAAANDALRSGKLAKRLANDHKLLASLVDSLLNAPRIAELIKSRTDAIAEDERLKIRAHSDAVIHQELESLRLDLLRKMEREIASLRLAAMQEVDQRGIELARELSERERQGWLDISENLVARMADLQSEASELTDHCRAMNTELQERTRDVESCSANLDALRKQEQAVLENLDRVLAITSVAQAKGDSFLPRNLVPLPPLDPGSPLLLSEVAQFVQDSQLLTDTGKRLMLRFLVLLLAGDVPVLCGPDVDDFLSVAERMFANGVSSRLECDPTVITFEDLWLRPGSDVQTSLGVALASTKPSEGTCVRTRIGVIAGAECSGARFWFPPLAARARRGELPRRLLVCVTIQDQNGEEAESLLNRATRIDIHGALSPEAAIVALRSPAGLTRELDPGERPTDLSAAIPVLAPYLRQLSFAAAQRAAQAVVEAKNIGTSTDSLIDLFTVTPDANTAVVTKLRS